MAKETLSPMQQEILQRADSIFNSISAGAAKAADFASEQIPDIAMQYVAFGRAYETFWVALAVISAIVFVVAIARNARKSMGFDDDLAFPITVFSGIGLVLLPTTLLASHLKSFMLVWFAPKMWLILEITHLVKG